MAPGRHPAQDGCGATPTRFNRPHPVAPTGDVALPREVVEALNASIGLGMTHYPMLLTTDELMAVLLAGTLTDPDIPDKAKDPAGWPDSMRAEWSDDQGAAAAARHREALVEGLSRVRAALDEFEPDIVVVWGDDQYENFREEIIPPFCVLAYDDLEVAPFGMIAQRHLPNAWGAPDDALITIHGDAAAARTLTDALIEDGFDTAYSYRKRDGAHFPHSILNTQVFLDFANYGQTFPYRILPITVNCYGQHVIARKGGMARFADIKNERLDPVGPTPARCYAFGAAVSRALSNTGKRVAYVASASWSHAFLNDKDWHLRPDTAADRRLFDAMVGGDHDTWTKATTTEIVDAGQHELLNWFCLLGAVHEQSLAITWSSFIQSDVFNSNKAFAVFRGQQR
jgi:hypothetical protein